MVLTNGAGLCIMRIPKIDRKQEDIGRYPKKDAEPPKEDGNRRAGAGKMRAFVGDEEIKPQTDKGGNNYEINGSSSQGG